MKKQVVPKVFNDFKYFLLWCVRLPYHTLAQLYLRPVRPCREASIQTHISFRVCYLLHERHTQTPGEGWMNAQVNEGEGVRH